MERNLKATLQKDYYGKAKVREESGLIILKSYSIDVVAIDPAKNEIRRLWSGWSATTARHINDFLGQYGFGRLSKKEWLSMPCANPCEVYAVYLSNGYTTHKGSALLTDEEAETERQRIKAQRPALSVWYD